MRGKKSIAVDVKMSLKKFQVIGQQRRSLTLNKDFVKIGSFLQIL